MIQVKIPKSLNDRLGHETLVGANMVSELTKAGIPVVGTLHVVGVERGNLTYSSTEFDHVYTWDGAMASVEEDLFS